MMNEYDYIDNYFNGLLSADEIKQFDQKIQQDPAFAEDVAFYCGSMQQIKEQVAEEKKNRFREIYKTSAVPGKLKSLPVNRWWPYATAAAVITGIVFIGYLWMTPSPQQLAGEYTKQHLLTMPVTMGSREDSLQTGLRLYNEESFEKALAHFENILQADPDNYTVKKYAGIVSLRLQQYDKSLQYFVALENYPGLFSNPGKFYHALTLMERNLPGDKQQAKQLLQQVVQYNLEGKEDAVKWLKRW